MQDIGCFYLQKYFYYAHHFNTYQFQLKIEFIQNKYDAATGQLKFHENQKPPVKIVKIKIYIPFSAKN